MKLPGRTIRFFSTLLFLVILPPFFLGSTFNTPVHLKTSRAIYTTTTLSFFQNDTREEDSNTSELKPVYATVRLLANFMTNTTQPLSVVLPPPPAAHGLLCHALYFFIAIKAP